MLENKNNEVAHDDDSRDDEGADNHQDDEDGTEIHVAQELSVEMLTKKTLVIII